MEFNSGFKGLIVYSAHNGDESPKEGKASWCLCAFC